MKKLITHYLACFYRDQRGVYAVVMALMTIFLIILVAFTLQTSHMFSQKARLSDGLEQAVLAVTTENNQFRIDGSRNQSVIDDTNNNLVNNYVRSYIPNSSDLNFKTVCYRDYCPECERGSTYCGVTGKFSQNSLFPISISRIQEKNYKPHDFNIPKQVQVGSSAYAKSQPGNTEAYAQDIIIAFNLSSDGDSTWGNAGGGKNPSLCNAGERYLYRDDWIVRYASNCVNDNTGTKILKNNSNGILPYSKMDFMDKILFSQSPWDWLPLRNYSNQPKEVYEGLVTRLFDFQHNTFSPGDRVRFMLSDFAYPDPIHYETKCVFPFLMKKVGGEGFYDWFYSDPEYSRDRYITHWLQYNFGYTISPVNDGDFAEILNNSLRRMTFHPIATDWSNPLGRQRFAKHWNNGLIFTSLLLQYLDTKGTALSFDKFGDEKRTYVSIFGNKSDMTDFKPNDPPEYKNTLTCFPNTSERSTADSGWVNAIDPNGNYDSADTSDEGDEYNRKKIKLSNQEGFDKIHQVFQSARPGAFSFLPTALMQAATNALVGKDSEENKLDYHHRKIILIIAGNTQSLFTWSGGYRKTLSGNNYTKDYDILAQISYPTRLATATVHWVITRSEQRYNYADPNTPRGRWWRSLHDKYAIYGINGRYKRRPLSHVLYHYAYCNTGEKNDVMIAKAFNVLLWTQNKKDCEAGYLSRVGLIKPAGWVDYDKEFGEGVPAAVPNPLVDVLSEDERKDLPDIYHKGQPGADALFEEINRVPYIEGVFQRLQYELLVQNKICDHIRDHLEEITKVSPLIAVVFISNKRTPAEAYWEQCVSTIPDPQHPGQNKKLLFHVTSAEDFKHVVNSIIFINRMVGDKKTGVLNINKDAFDELRKNATSSQ